MSYQHLLGLCVVSDLYVHLNLLTFRAIMLYYFTTLIYMIKLHLPSTVYHYLADGGGAGGNG